MGNIFNTILVDPLLNVLVFAYQYIPDVGVVIILITALVRLAMMPSFHKSLKHQKALADLQPKMDEIKQKYKDDKEQQAKAMMELYKIHKVNPLSSCLPLLIQLPILIALYQVFIKSLNGGELEGLYSFVQNPGTISPMFFNWVNLANPNVIFAAIAAVLQYYQAKLMLPKQQSQDTTARMISYQTLYFLPAVTLFIGFKLPASLPLYWIVTTAIGLAQQYYIIRKEAKQGLEKAS
jgi:YidC/Oxa1 family membrane protein insertase